MAKLNALILGLVFVVFIAFLSACGPMADGDIDSQNDDDDDAFSAQVDPPADDDAAQSDDDDDNQEPNTPSDIRITPPLGENPALEDGDYEVARVLIDLPLKNEDQPSAYFYYPKNADLSEPLPTLVWGHGMMSAYDPSIQEELFRRQAAKGYLVIFPNMDVPVNFWTYDILECVAVYLDAVKMAVELGMADPNRIIFGGYSMGARVASLATAKTTGMDPFHIWPDPIACVYEALRDIEPGDPALNFAIPGPQPSDWAAYIDPSIPQTIIAAEDDTIVQTYSDDMEQIINGGRFFRNVPTLYTQLIILKSGSKPEDIANHECFQVPSEEKLNVIDLWGNLKIVEGITLYYFAGGSKEWAYGYMRIVGGLDSAGLPIVHEVFERDLNQPETPLEPQNDTM